MARLQAPAAMLRAGAAPAANRYPKGLRTVMEAMSGFPLARIVVHRNSADFAQSDRIPVAPGPDRHLPHEPWPVVQRKQGGTESSLPAGTASGAAPTTGPRAAVPNGTGLPDRLKAGVEALSGLSFDGVRVHYNSSKPVRLGAHACAQGADIHLAPGQEHHLPHEAWHVVQQAQGRVRPTGRQNGIPVFHDEGLEAEADRMGARAAGGAPRAARPFGPFSSAGHVGDSSMEDEHLARGPRAIFGRAGMPYQLKAKALVDQGGLKVERDGDLKYLMKELVKMGGVYRHMSPKHSRLEVARYFLMKNHASDPVFEEAKNKLIPLQNQLTGWEYFTEHLGKQFMGSAEENKKLTGGQYDSLILAAQNAGKKITPLMITTEIAALAENYMYIYLSKHGSSEEEFRKAVSHGSQMTLDAMWIFGSMKEQITETAEALGVSPDAVLELLRTNVSPQMVQHAMNQVWQAAHSTFVKKEWIGPTTQSGAPHGSYFNKGGGNNNNNQ